MSRNIRTRLTCEKDHAPLEVLRVTPPPSGYPFADAPQPPFVRQERRVHLRLDIPRSDRVDRDPLRGPLVGQRFCQLCHRAFGRGVGGDGESTLEREQAGKVDDASSAAGGGRGFEGEHMGADVAAEREYRREVYLEDL